MKDLVIKESRWLTGKDIDINDDGKLSSLYRSSDKKMCCLGFLGRKCGLKVSEIKNIGYPYSIRNSLLKKWPEELIEDAEDTYSLCEYIMEINDNNDLTHSERKKRLKPLFKKFGYNLKFEK